MSDSNVLATALSTVTEKSTPTCKSVPARSFGSIFVPRWFQTSGVTFPTMRNVFVFAPGLGSGSG